MATSVYFNNFSASTINEQRLMEDVIVESIKIMGHDCWYVAREDFKETDALYGENVQSKFEKAYNMEVYLANVEGYEGDGDFFSKFGLEIRDTSNFVISRRSFERYVPSNTAARPREGDLIFVPVINKLFEIKFVEEELMFFSLGKRSPYIYELRCEMFRFSQENINTGIGEIDIIDRDNSYTIKIGLGGGSGNYFQDEVVYQGSSLSSSSASGTVKTWSNTDKILELYNIKGGFVANTNVIGSKSGASYSMIDMDDMGDFTDYDAYDNRVIQTEADSFIDFSEINPFGKP
jgi:hypothetical protein